MIAGMLYLLFLTINFIISIIFVYQSDEQTKGVKLHGMIGWCYALMILALFMFW